MPRSDALTHVPDASCAAASASLQRGRRCARGRACATRDSRRRTRRAIMVASTFSWLAVCTSVLYGWCVGIWCDFERSTAMTSACLPGSSEPIEVIHLQRTRSVKRRHLHELARVHEALLPEHRPLHEQPDAHLLEDVHRVGRRRRVGAKPDANAGAQELLDRRDTHAELGLAARAVRDGDVVRRKHLDVVVVDLRAVDGQDVGDVEQAPLQYVANRTDAGRQPAGRIGVVDVAHVGRQHRRAILHEVVLLDASREVDGHRRAVRRELGDTCGRAPGGTSTARAARCRS